jgi:hypothetical protein
MSLTIRMCATPNKPNLDKVIKSNKRLKTAFHSQKRKRMNHRVALDELDTFLELVDDAMDAMNDVEVVSKDAQDKLYKLYDFCGEVPMNDECKY